MLTITIQEYTFFFPPRAQEGHVLTADEAVALNQIYSENIRNNVDQWVQLAVAQSSTPLLSPEDCEALQQRIAEYAQNYQFTPRAGGQRLGPLELALRSAAAEHAVQKGVFPGDDDWEEKILTARGLPEVQASARQLLLARRKTAQVAAEALDL
jgi:hypothetical protein